MSARSRSNRPPALLICRFAAELSMRSIASIVLRAVVGDQFFTPSSTRLIAYSSSLRSTGGYVWPGVCPSSNCSRAARRTGLFVSRMLSNR